MENMTIKYLVLMVSFINLSCHSVNQDRSIEGSYISARDSNESYQINAKLEMTKHYMFKGKKIELNSLKLNKVESKKYRVLDNNDISIGTLKLNNDSSLLLILKKQVEHSSGKIDAFKLLVNKELPESIHKSKIILSSNKPGRYVIIYNNPEIEFDRNKVGDIIFNGKTYLENSPINPAGFLYNQYDYFTEDNGELIEKIDVSTHINDREYLDSLHILNPLETYVLSIGMNHFSHDVIYESDSIEIKGDAYYIILATAENIRKFSF